MKKFLLILTLVVVISSIFAVPALTTAFALTADNSLNIQSRSCYVVDYDTNTLIMEKDSDK
ncbi:MAG TPA: hypothetical protein VJ903_02055, partial [Clostridia bacterium]|nr:hypothetical protein [Clostridia bacterium]